MHPGMAVHFDSSIHCEGVVGPRNFKLGGIIEKSYGTRSRDKFLICTPVAWPGKNYVTSHR